MKNNLSTSSQSKVLSVEDKVKAALALATFEGNLARISISNICKQAGINRANLYASHPNLVAHIQSLKIKSPSKKTAIADINSLRIKIKNLEKRNNALLLLLVDMANRLRMAQNRLTRNSRISKIPQK